MNPTFVKFFEIAFNIGYLVMIWFYLIKMYKSHTSSTGNILRLSFLFLAFGDTFHVGLRVVAHLMGDINSTIMFFGTEARLIGIGAFMTAVTVTATYMLFSKAFAEKHERSNSHKWIIYLSVVRFILIVLPQNNWLSVASYEISIIRNVPLILIGIIIVFEFIKFGTGYFKSFGYLIILSYVFYLPVIFGVKFIPMLGMLMIPKTVAYLFMLILVYKNEFKAVS